MKISLIRIIPITLVLFPLLFLNSCAKETDYSKRDDKSINEYLLTKNLTAQKTASGLYYLITAPGSSQKPDLNSQVKVHYKGYFLNDSVFESSYSGTAPTFPLKDVIAGWREGIQLFGKGGQGTLFLPSHLAYGNKTMPGIPANSVLIFDIHLINIE